MFPMSNDINAAFPTRLWWAPWRWSLSVCRWNDVYRNFNAPETIATNINKAEVIGLMKLLGYPHEIST
jgi:uncharacterized protein (DUF2237 family)